MGRGKRNIYLVGPMGSGKTTIGQRLAQRLGLEFFDSDQEIESRTGVSINLIFEIEGEAGFRKRESSMLKELSTGGGAVLSAGNRKLLRQTGTVIYLETPVKRQLQRLRRDVSRPLLKTPDRARKLEEMAEKRNPLYEEVADLTFPARAASVDKAVNSIFQALSKPQAGKAPSVRQAQAHE